MRVATTAIEIARRRAWGTAADISPLMLERAEVNAQAAVAGARQCPRTGALGGHRTGDLAFPQEVPWAR